MSVCQGRPCSPTFSGLLSDGLHDHLHLSAMTAGIQFRSGKWVLSLVYAGDIVLLSWSASGLRLLLDSMYHVYLALGLVISPTKTEVVVCNGQGNASIGWVGNHVLLQSASFKYLGMVFHESGSICMPCSGWPIMVFVCLCLGKMQKALESAVLAHGEAIL